jgi:hypothetical protein
LPARSALLVALIVVCSALIGLGVGLLAPLGESSAATAREAARREALAERQWPLYGFVLDEELYPIANASLVVVDTAAAFTSDVDGSYAASAKPGTYLVIASAPGYRAAAASLTVFSVERTRHDFVLAAKPTGIPYHTITPTTLHIGCAGAVNGIAFDCSVAFSPNRLQQSIDVPVSTSNALLEVHWEAQSTFATHMNVRSDFMVDGSRIEVADVGGTSGLSLWLLDWFLQKHLAAGATWDSVVGVAAPLGGDNPSGNKGGTGLGFAQDQVVIAYSTLFHYTPGPGNFTALTD